MLGAECVAVLVVNLGNLAMYFQFGGDELYKSLIHSGGYLRSYWSLLVIGIAGALLLSLIACGGTTDEESSSSADKRGGTLKVGML